MARLLQPAARAERTKARIALEAGERGQYEDLQWLYYYMERSDPMIFSILQRRRAALLDSDWDIRQVPGESARVARGGAEVAEGFTTKVTKSTKGSDQVLADEQAVFLREAYDGIENLRDALASLFSGFFRGYAHQEKHYGDQGLIERLETTMAVWEDRDHIRLSTGSFIHRRLETTEQGRPPSSRAL